ncbi:helix-turn-helix domain-containing protein [Rodentibacter genomosp. 1]|uniref:helix-turn-helix domain-containing protein n=1 Tax=Rodentibacter genomosp. 1 TaxID=1908264 RepID=UPI001FCA274C|nr:DNA-binding protein [Rodentibacter genomosp. 1]
MIQEWFELKELTGVGGLPTTVQGITKKAKLENWQRRRITGVKGKVFEYYVGDMPPSVQAALGFDVSQDGFTQKGDEFEQIPDLSVTESGVMRKYFHFRTDWLKKMAISIAHSTFFKMPDNAMERTIYKGDRALITLFFHDKVKRGLATLEDVWRLKEGLYVVRINNRLTIRRLQFDLPKGLYVLSDNPDYHPIHLTADQIDPTMIIGQVRWYAHTVQWD